MQTERKIRVNTTKKRELNRKFETLASLSNDDGDGNENSKKGIGYISTTTILHVHASRVFVHFFAVVSRMQRELPSFTFCEGREHRRTIFFF